MLTDQSTTLHSSGTILKALRKHNRDLESHHVAYAIRCLVQAGKLERSMLSGSWVYQASALTEVRDFLVASGHVPLRALSVPA